MKRNLSNEKPGVQGICKDCHGSGKTTAKPGSKQAATKCYRCRGTGKATGDYATK